MTDHNFRLTVRGRFDATIADALFTAGCDDATVSSKGDLIFAEFDRDAPSILVAVTSAIGQVESVDGLEVVHVDPDELVWASEIAQRVGRTRQSVDQLVRGQRGPGDFPSPATHTTRNPLWRWSEIEAWFAGYEGREPSTERSIVIGAINGALQARHSLRGSHDAVPLRRALERLLAS